MISWKFWEYSRPSFSLVPTLGLPEAKEKPMAVVAPFRGLFYNYEKMQNPALLMAPPYDVISEEEQGHYYEAHPLNVIRLILGKKKKGDSDWDNVYTRAADYLRRWESEGHLIRAGKPVLCVTALEYPSHREDELRTRWGIIGVVRIEEEHSRVILPHERTFSAHKDDRLRLFKACNAQLSQVFGLYEDKENRILDTARAGLTFPPQVSFELGDRTRHRMWVLRDPHSIRAVSEGLFHKRIFIADGHHRYETSRNYRNMMRARYGTRPANRAYEFVMMVLTNMNDEGLTILPSHRLLRFSAGFDPTSFLETLERWFQIEPMPWTIGNGSDQSKDLRQALERLGASNTAFAFCCNAEPRIYLLSLKGGMRDALGDDLHPSLKALDVLVLSRLIFQKALGFQREDLDNQDLFRYESNMDKALSSVLSGESRMAFLLNPTKMAHVIDIAQNGLVMPRKSTYFFPKVPTGLVFNKIDPHELIHVP
jgi:uncharacterized protein (DUF1015 family)